MAKLNFFSRHHASQISSSSPSNPNLDHPAQAASVKSKADEDYERWLHIKLNLDENKGLKEQIQKLKEQLELADRTNREKDSRLEGLEEELRNKKEEVGDLRVDLNSEKVKVIGLQRNLTEMRCLARNLYCAAAATLDKLGGTVRPFNVILGSGNASMLLDKFCIEYKEKFVEWENSHQTVHNQLVKVLKKNERKIEDQQGQLENRGNEVLGLREELGRLREKEAAMVEQQNQEEEQQQQLKEVGNSRVDEIKAFVEKMYSLPRPILEGLGVEVTPFHPGEEGDWDLGQLEQLYALLREKLSGWENDHQMVHDQVKQLKDLMEGVELDDIISGGTCAHHRMGGGEHFLPTLPQASSSCQPNNDRLDGPPGANLTNIPGQEMANQNDNDDTSWENPDPDLDSTQSKFVCDQCGDLHFRLKRVHCVAVSKIQSRSINGPPQSEEQETPVTQTQTLTPRQSRKRRSANPKWTKSPKKRMTN